MHIGRHYDAKEQILSIRDPPRSCTRICKDNLSKDQEENLKDFWISIINKILSENKISLESIFDSTDGKELFYMFANDNPDVILLRRLRARKWNVNLALDQFIQTLKWRYQYGVTRLVADGEHEIYHEELLTGKTSYIGYDKVGRPIVYISVKDHIKGQFPLESTEKLSVLSMEIEKNYYTIPLNL
ncbi:unnamed protein product [Rotaria sp. Silwood2]|nr:unnamed protein product [Rotaria sp. Silwood2]CAF4075119.1 unnamed protein product [Rotaria sp. Silwood2]